MRRKMIILNYCLPIENLDTLYRSVKSLDTYKKKKKEEVISIQLQSLHPKTPDVQNLPRVFFSHHYLVLSTSSK